MADITQQEFNQMLAVAIAGGLCGGTYISRWDGEQIDDGIAKLQLPGGITATELADGAVTWPKLAVDARPTRRNLLDNAYFIGGGSQQGGGQFPINQRGQTEYTTAGYTIDGWHVERGGSIALADDGIVFTTPADRYCVFAKKIENYKDLVGKTLTFSVLIRENTVGNIYLWAYGGASVSNAYITPIQGPGLYTITFTPNDTINQMRVGVQGRNSAGSVKIAAFKLEPGNQQTLAHKDADGNWVQNGPPQDYGLELLKCQRYFQTFATQGERPTKGADFRPVMRTENPTLGTITLPDGTVLYTASSEL